MSSIEQQVREKVVRKYIENPGFSFRKIAKLTKTPKTTVCDIINRYNNTLSVNRSTGSGQNHPPDSKATDKKVVAAFKRNPSLSIRDVAKKVNKSSAYVQKVKIRAGLQSFKVVKTPNRDDKQNSAAKTRARKLYDSLLRNYSCVIMDDETYLKADFKQLPGQEFYTANTKGNVPEKFKSKKLSKFPKKYLIWQAICTCGRRSKMYVARGSVNQDIYVKECLEKLLLPFINSHDTTPLFWPDLASCHYGRQAMNWYESNGVHVVPKDCNPPNTPELRPIEVYWAEMKKNLKKTKGVAKDEKDLKRRWKIAENKVTEDIVRALMGGVKSKVRAFAYNS